VTAARAVFTALGVDTEVMSPAELKRTYRKLASLHHPDRPGNDRAASQRVMMDLNGAYALLSGKEQEQPDFGGWGPTGGFDVDDDDFMGGPAPGGPPGGFAFGAASAREQDAAMRAQQHFMRNGPPNPAFGFPLVVGGVHMPRHPTADAIFFDPLAGPPGRQHAPGAVQPSPGYVVLLVPPDLTPAFMRAGMGTASSADWAAVRAWAAEQGLERMYNDMRTMSGPRLGGGRGPRGYLNRRPSPAWHTSGFPEPSAGARKA